MVFWNSFLIAGVDLGQGSALFPRVICGPNPASNLSSHTCRVSFRHGQKFVHLLPRVYQGPELPGIVQFVQSGVTDPPM